jgi:Fic family protein
MLSQLSQIAEIKATVERSHLLPAREAFLRRTAIIKMAHSSTSIEGNQLEEYQVKNINERKQVIAQKNQIQEVKNYLLALKQIDALSQSRGPFTAEDILSVHRRVIEGLVTPEKAGTWRKGPVYIVNVSSGGRETLQYTPPPHTRVPQLIEQLLGWLKSNPTVHPIIRAGIFHYQFETIHPFADGNGRAGRLLTLLHLYQSGWAFKKALVLEDYYNQNRKSYYQHLQTGKTYQERHAADLTPWLEYYIDGFLHEALIVKDSILNMSVVNTGSIGPDILDSDELKIVDFAISIGKITSSDVCDILHIPKRTAQFKLKKLEGKRVLIKVEAGPKSYYAVNRD